MKAEDTVMNKAQLEALTRIDRDSVLLAQAELTGKIMRQEGRKEVVEWIETLWKNWPESRYIIDSEDWVTKLKDWGL